MALIPVKEQFSINETNTYVLGDGSTNNVATWLIDIVPVTPGSITVAVQGRSITIGGASVTTPGFAAIPYRALVVNGATGTMAYIATVITDRSIIKVDGSGLNVTLDVTYASGDYVVYARPLNGPNT